MSPSAWSIAEKMTPDIGLTGIAVTGGRGGLRETVLRLSAGGQRVAPPTASSAPHDGVRRVKCAPAGQTVAIHHQHHHLQWPARLIITRRNSACPLTADCLHHVTVLSPVCKCKCHLEISGPINLTHRLRRIFGLTIIINNARLEK